MSLRQLRLGNLLRPLLSSLLRSERCVIGECSSGGVTRHKGISRHAIYRFTQTARCAIAAAVICSTIGCSSSRSSTVADRKELGSFKEHSSREIEAARKLSLTSYSSLVSAGNEYERALRCRTALLHLGGALRKSGAATAAQLALLRRGEEMFENLALQRGVHGGKQSSEIKRDLEMHSGGPVDLEGDARTGVACLRILDGHA